MEKHRSNKHYIFASDFDQTLSYNDSGYVLSELLGIPTKEFERRAEGMARLNLVQQGGELAYLLLHDPEFHDRVRPEHLREVGKRIRLKENIAFLHRVLETGIAGYHFEFYVTSAAPVEVIQSALENIVPADHIFGTQFRYHPSGEIAAIEQVTAGYGKVAVLDRIQEQAQISSDRIVYVGDGSSDVHVMLHVNRRDGFTIAVSENKHLAPIARRTVLSRNALGVLIPILEEIVGWERAQIRAFLETQGFVIQEWDKVATDVVTIRDSSASDLVNAVVRVEGARA
jgi:2-hydroxy-3-keto-5-methylthiopentenyl-1-phosphate phosphatase